MNPNTLRQPTGEECNTNAIIAEDDAYRAVAIWYPQMGGYVGRAVVMIYKPGENEAIEIEPSPPCFEVIVWHDGQFPFDEADHPEKQRASLHHCCGTQFVEFGKKVLELQGFNIEGEQL